MSSPTLLCYLFVAHAVCDYPLQGDFLARAKNHKQPIPGVPWFTCLLMHSLIHAGAVAILTGSMFLAFVELVIHICTDYAKSDGRFGFNTDQVIHLGCKVIYVIALIVLPRLP